MSFEPYRNNLQKKISELADDELPQVDDNSLIISITKRLVRLEKEIKNYKSLVEDKQNQIEILTQYKQDLENVLYQTSENENQLELLNKLEDLQIENQNCKRQIVEMELFLADYNMEWAGYRYDDEQMSDLSSTIHQQNNGNKRLKTHNHNSVYFNIDIMMQRIKELNSLVNYQHITKSESSNIYHFTSPPTVSLIFYSNGMFLKNGPLRQYKLPESKQFIRDILDGYFPSELKEEYPNGIIFNAQNCIDQEFDINIVQNVNAKQIISNLPKKVIEDGKIIDYQSKFQMKSKSKNSQDIIFLDTPTAKLLQSQGCLLTQNGAFKDLQISTLRIKSSNHNVTLILKMNALDTLAMVYELVYKYLQTMHQNNNSYVKDEELMASSPYKFELFCPFPKKIYNDLKQTLQQAKLIPNATLFLRYV